MVLLVTDDQEEVATSKAKEIVKHFCIALGDHIRDSSPDLRQCLTIAESLSLLSNCLEHSNAVIEVQSIMS